MVWGSRWRWGTAILACAACVSMRLPAQQAGMGSVEGTVVDAVTGQGVAGAVVSLAHGKEYSRVAVADPAGRFKIDAIETGQYFVEYVRAGGYLADVSRRSVTPAAIDIVDEHPVTGIRIKATPGAAVSGSVLDQRGRPIQGAMVVILSAADVGPLSVDNT